ncbi:MAG TPA: hypothetical protein VE270_00705 [Thermoleophilaceae bacterium]|nr:hypothetical protein [Thermoleophilaceae bacterium]
MDVAATALAVTAVSGNDQWRLYYQHWAQPYPARSAPRHEES